MKPQVLRSVFFTVLAAVVVSAVTLQLAPFLAKNLLFLAALPFAAALFLILVLNARTTFLFVLGTRALMDPLLAQTKMEGGVGIGGVLNLFLIITVVLLVVRFPKTLAKNSYLLPWMAFLVIGAVSVIYAPMPSQAVRHLLNLGTYLCMFVAPFFIVKNEEDKKFWIRVLVFSSFLPVAFANLGLVTRLPLFIDAEGRLRGTFTHPNILAFYLVFVVTIVFYALRTGSLKLSLPARVFFWLYLVDIFAVLVGTQTRSAWMACAALFMMYGLLKERKFIFIFLIGVLLLVPLPPVQERLKDLSQGTGAKRSEKLNSWSWRVKLWEYAVPSIKDKLLFGHGLDSFHLLSRDFFPLEKERGAPAHNVYVDVIFEVGLLGLLAYLWIYTRLLKVFYARMRAGPKLASVGSTILFCYIIGYLMVSVSDNMLYYLAFNWYFWFFIGLIVRSASYPEPEK